MMEVEGSSKHASAHRKGSWWVGLMTMLFVAILLCSSSMWACVELFSWM
jgi:hypothetical protein